MVYLLESATCLSVFYAMYILFLRRDTHHRLNRVYLLFSMIFSLLVPLMELSLPGTLPPRLVAFRMDPLTVGAAGGAPAAKNGPDPAGIVKLVYFAVFGLLVFRILMNYRVICRLHVRGRHLSSGHCKLVLHSRNYPPFSFFRNIFISEAHYRWGQIDDIIEHEKAHVRQWHSLDMLIAEGIIILQWFNPVAWLMKKSIKENHEFLADEAVLNRGFSPEAYQLRILAQLFGIRSMPAVHNFNQSITQKRLKMMEKSKSTAASGLKMLLTLPAAMLLFYMFACSSGQSELSAQNASDEDQKADVYYQVDQAAEPEGGVMAFRKHIAENIRYPEEAARKGVQGRVYIQFIVDEQGKLVTFVESSEVPPPPPPPPVPEKTDAGDVPPPPPPPEKIVREGIVVVGFRPPKEVEAEYAGEDIQLLADEAIRVIRESDFKWKPAMKDGKPVKSAWTMPIVFTLE